MKPAYRIIMSMRVAEELERIFDFIAEDSPKRASGEIASILSAIDGLAYFPFRQVLASCDMKEPLTRSLPVGSYIVFFSVDEKNMAVSIEAVQHGARRRSR